MQLLVVWQLFQIRKDHVWFCCHKQSLKMAGRLLEIPGFVATKTSAAI